MHMCHHTCVEVRDNLRKSVLSFHHVGPKDQTLVVSLNPLSYLGNLSQPTLLTSLLQINKNTIVLEPYKSSSLSSGLAQESATDEIHQRSTLLLKSSHYVFQLFSYYVNSLQNTIFRDGKMVKWLRAPVFLQRPRARFPAPTQHSTAIQNSSCRESNTFGPQAPG